MLNSGFRFPERGASLFQSLNDRRRAERRKAHLPALASFEGTSDANAKESSDVVDLSEDGACIQTAAPLKLESTLTLSLDLLETNAFVSALGTVVWSDKRGRSGIHFQGISNDSRQLLKTWLVRDTMEDHPQSAISNELEPLPVRSVSGRSEVRRQSVKRETIKQSPEQLRAALAASKPAEQTVPSDPAAVLSTLVAVKHEVEAAEGDIDRILRLLAERALSLTRASGSAIALARYKAADEMICRTRAGSDAPGLGAKLQVGSGFSGECVRTGKVLRCDDSDTDPRVDREGCRMLGIRALIAAPIRRDESVTGILEIFSPLPDAFGPSEEKILERLAEMAAGALDRDERGIRHAANAPALAGVPIAIPTPRVALQAGRLDDTAYDERLETSSPLRKWLPLIFGAAVLACVLWMALGNGKSIFKSRAPRSDAQQNVGNPVPATSSTDFESLRRLASNGDPDAQFDMGAKYATGEDIKQDYVESVRWFTLAAEQGHVIAQATLGAYYWAGRGIPQDLSKAYFWSAIAAAGGDQASRFRVTVLASRMPRSQVAAAELEANTWLKKHQVSGKVAR